MHAEGTMARSDVGHATYVRGQQFERRAQASWEAGLSHAATRFETATSEARQVLARPESIDSRARSTASGKFAPASAATSAAAALSTTTSRAGPGSPSRIALTRAALSDASPPRNADSGAGSKPGSPESSEKSRTPSGVTS